MLSETTRYTLRNHAQQPINVLFLNRRFVNSFAAKSMESFGQQSFLTFLVLVFAAALLLLHSRKTRLRLPPGPRRLPVIGSLHHLLAGGQLPHRRLRDLAGQHGPVMYLQLGQIPTVVISSPDAAREIMKTHDRAFASRPAIISARIFSYGCRDIVCAPYGEYWRAVKKMCTLDLLSARRVMSYRRVREEEVSALLESISNSAKHDAGAVNLSERFNALSNAVTCRAAIGSKNEHQEVMLASMEELLQVSSGLDLADLYPMWESMLMWLTGTKRVFTKVFRKLDAVLDRVIGEHRAKFAAREQKGSSGGDGGEGADEGEENLLDVLVRHYERQDLSFELSISDIKAVFQDIFIAGTDTSATTMEWAMSELMSNPEAMDKAQAEARRVFRQHGKLDETVIDQLHYLKLVINETLRLHPPVPLLVPRECMETTMVGGFEIQQGTRVLVNVWALGRDPSHWSDGEKFKPERFLHDGSNKSSGPVINFMGTDFRFLPFGAGRRMCPGASFGLAVVEVALARLLCHFDWQLPKGDKCVTLNMEEKFAVTISRKFPLCLVATNHIA